MKVIKHTAVKRPATRLLALAICLITLLSACGGTASGATTATPSATTTTAAGTTLNVATALPATDETGVTSRGETTVTVAGGTSTGSSALSVPSYSGQPYVTLNNNQPVFSSAELTTTAYEKYAALDKLGRCGVAIASCGREIMPADGETRGDISRIFPSGWVQAAYDSVDGKYLYNRSHLIGWQLSAENDNPQNLITGTRYMNTKGMLPFENMVADYIRETDHHVAYRVTPIYEGNNLLPSGVEMEAYSVEDRGEGICFHVYVYNIQPGIVIDYATGNSRTEGGASVSSTKTVGTTTKTTVKATVKTTAKATAKPTAFTTEKTSSAVKSDQSVLVWIPQTGSKYHCKSDCSGMKDPTQVTLEEAVRRSYEPCKRCYK